jgi:hypothetical protein
MADPEMEEVPQTSVFRGVVQELSPPWLAGDQGYRFTYSAIGVPLDALAEYLRIGVLQRFPSKAQGAALPFIGSDLKIIRGFRESDDAYIPRLQHAVPTWRLAGNAQTLLTELAAYFSPTPPIIRYVVNGTYLSGNRFTDWWTIQNGVISHYRTPDTFAGNNWNWDGQTDQIRFWIIIYRNEGFTPWFWGDGHYWGGGQSWGYEENFTENFAVDARNFIQQWKAAGSHAWISGGLIVTGDATLLDPTGSGAGYPDGTWSTYANRAGIPTTFYLDGI